MSDSQACLSEKDLRELGNTQLSAQQLEQFENHLTDCKPCRELLDATDVNPFPDWQSEIRPALRETHDLGLAETRGEDTARHETFLRLLSPSEDPKMLGRVGNYEVVGIIGQGGMGVVFKAFETALNRFVAIKMLLPHLTANGAARKRFLREAQAAAAVVDDHVLPIFGVNQWQETPYLVMKYSAGQTLQQRISQQGPLDVKEVLRIGMQGAKGLAAAHAQGLVHRDVKPSNILLDGSVDRAVLMDFGLARAVDDASTTRTGIISGTPQYMSPEQVRADSVDARSDLFSLGSTLYAMCAGRPPFRSESAYGVMHRITHEEPTPICEVNSDVPPWLGMIIERLMSKTAEDRFESADEVADLMEGCLAHVQQPTTTKLPEALASVSSNRGGSFSWGKWLAIASFAFLFASAGVLLVIELNKGKLVIECATNDVPIRIVQGDVEVEKLTVSKDGATIRISAGEYKVEVDGDYPGVSIEQNSVTLSRGGSSSVVITLAAAAQEFDTPEQLMKHFGDCRFRADFAGIASCFDDAWAEATAFSWLASAVHLEQTLTERRYFSKDKEVFSTNEQQLKELQALLDDTGVSSSQRGEFARMLEKMSFQPGKEDLLDSEIIIKPWVVKRPRTFLQAFGKFASAESDLFPTPGLKPTYCISREGKRTFATEEAAGDLIDLKFRNGSWLISGGRPLPVRQVLPSSGPEKVFLRYVRFVEEKNWEAVRTCVTDDCRDEFNGESLINLYRLQAQFAKVSRVETQKTIRPRTDEFLDELHSQFPALAGFSTGRERAEVEAELLANGMTNPDPHQRRRARLAMYDRFFGDERERMFIKFSEFLHSLPGNHIVRRFGKTLLNLDIERETATAGVGKLKLSDEVSTLSLQPIEFKKVAGQWKIDVLGKSVYEQMRDSESSLKKKAEARLETNDGDHPVASELNPSFHGVRESFWDTYFKHLSLKTKSFFPEVKNVAPVIHWEAGKLVLFSDGKVFVNRGRRTFSDQLSKSEFDSLLAKVAEQDMAELALDYSSLKYRYLDPSKIHDQLPTTMRFSLEEAPKGYQESIEIITPEKSLFVMVAPPKRRRGSRHVDRSQAPTAYKNVERILERLSTQTVAGGKKSITTYLKFANERLAAKFPDAPPLTENASIRVSLVKQKDGNFVRRIEIRKRETSVQLEQAVDESLTIKYIESHAKN